MDCKELDTTERLCTAQHLQMQSCAEVLGVRASAYVYGRYTFQCITRTYCSVLNTASFATQVVWGPGDRNTYIPVLSFSHNNQLARKKGLPFTSSLPQEQGCEPETCLQDTVSTQGEKHLPSPHVINSPHWSYSRVWIPTAFSPHPSLVLGRHSQKQVDADGWLCRPMNS